MRGFAVLVGLCMLLAACGDTDLNGRPFASTTPPAASAPSPPTTTVTTQPAPTPTSSAAPTTTTSTATTTTTTEPPGELIGVELELVAEVGRTLAITTPPGDPRLFLAGRDGVIRIISSDRVVEEPFLDITDRVKSSGVEQGLLGMAFHPEYADNGRFFVLFIDGSDATVLTEFVVSSNPNVADPGSAREVLFIDQPTDRHNGGMVEFGPDGMLYVAVGDGGDGGHHGQKPDTLLGTLLRLDVSTPGMYTVPPDNPFVAGGGAPEVWAYGLRNPWRFSFDEGHVYIGDVGQADREEIDVISLEEAGANFGWIYLEGSMCFRAPECRDVETVLPVIEYSHSEGCSVTGGVVYRGEAIPELNGTYFYSDWCRGWLRSFRYSDGEVSEETEWGELEPGQVNTFGVDSNGELYLANWEGVVWRLVPVRAGD